MGPISEELAATGDTLFRRRSYMPLVLVPLFVLSVLDDRHPTSPSWELFCFLVALSGLVVRASVVGTAPHGASTRGTRRPTADSLSTLGAYSIVRHPLYVANTLVAVGCSMLSGTWYLPVIVVLLSVVYHERIAAREEAFLLTAFGDTFRAWANEVPAMVPAFGRYRSANVPFQLQKVVMQESHGLCAIGTAFLVLDTLEDSVRLGYFHIDPMWLAIFVATCIPFLIVVIVKAPAARARREAAERERAGWLRHPNAAAALGTPGPASIDKSANIMSGMRVRLGSERLLDSGALKNKRVGVVSNPASIDARFQHVVRAIANAPGATLAAIFGPQHGYRADVQDNMIETGHANDPTRGVPVYSLYSETREPTADMLKGLDVLVIDLQDVGSRIYTFIYTMANCLHACRKHGVPVIVTDRPNPIGGIQVGGPMLVKGFESFVGQFPIPMRHGMTIAELARFFNDACGIRADLTVVPMEDWKRTMYFDDTGLPWVMPSPNMPTIDTAVVYPGTVLFEGTNVSEGRGTTRPFELIGAPWVDAEALADKLATYDLPGVLFRPVVFEPTFHKHAKQVCGGCQIHILDRDAARIVETAVAVLVEIRAQNPAKFEWRQPPYEYEHEKLPFDILAGSSELRQQIEAGLPVRTIYYSWVADHEQFRKTREPFLLY